MPYNKYRFLRKAAEIEGVRERLSLITDMGAAFSGNREHILDLKKLLKELTGKQILTNTETSNPDPDWEKKLLRFKR